MNCSVRFIFFFSFDFQMHPFGGMNFPCCLQYIHAKKYIFFMSFSLIKNWADRHLPRHRQTNMKWPLHFHTVTLISMVAIDWNITRLSNNMVVTKRSNSLWNSVWCKWICNQYVRCVFIHFNMWYHFASIYIMSVSKEKFGCKKRYQSLCWIVAIMKQ